MKDITAKYKYKKALVLTLKEGVKFEEILKNHGCENVSQYIKKRIKEGN